MSTTLGIKVDEALRERIRAAAQNLGRTPHWLLKQAVVQYVDALERGLPSIRIVGTESAAADALESEESALAPHEVQPFCTLPNPSCRKRRCARPLPPPGTGPRPNACPPCCPWRG